jgi:ABC-2 type transport system ATP-binding protein
VTSNEPVLVLRAVVARALAGADLMLGRGSHVVLGRPEEGGAELVPLVTGLASPQSGVVRVGGRDPHRSAATRRTIGALLADESLPNARSVSALLELVLSGRADARPLLVAAGLGSHGERSPGSLHGDERRALALALALAVPDAVLLALYEPLATPLDRDWVLGRIGEAAERCCVLCVTASVRDASLLAPAALLLENGRFTRRPAMPLAAELTPGKSPELVVHASDARRLATRLGAHPAVRSVRWDETLAPDQLVVQGDDLEALALAVARAAADERIVIAALSPALPSIEAAHAATAALARAAYDNAYRAATAYGAPKA